MTPHDLYRDMHNRPDWQRDAVCAQADPEAWFPEKGGSTLAAKRICLTCPVVSQCLAHALEHEERFGVWGGHSERERRKLKQGPITPKPRYLVDQVVLERALSMLDSGMSTRAVSQETGINRSTLANRLRRRREAA